MNHNIIAHTWISGRMTLGVVITKDEIATNEQFKARIAPVLGGNEKYDLQYVADWGTRLEIIAAAAIMVWSGQFCSEQAEKEFYQYLRRNGNMLQKLETRIENACAAECSKDPNTCQVAFCHWPKCQYEERHKEEYEALRSFRNKHGMDPNLPIPNDL